MPPDDSVDAFINRKDWNAHDLTKLRTAVIDWKLSLWPIDEFAVSIAGQFPTRSVEAIIAKMDEIKDAPQSAVQSRIEEVSSAQPAVSRFDEKYRWTDEESAKLKALLTNFDASAGDSAQRWGKELVKEFPGRTAGSISQRILRLGYSGPPRSSNARAQRATSGKVDPWDIVLGELGDIRSAVDHLEARVEGMRDHQNEPAALVTQAIEALRQFDTKLALEILQQARRK